jgi:hypothetical protein
MRGREPAANGSAEHALAQGISISAFCHPAHVSRHADSFRENLT